MEKSGQGLSLNTIIIAAIALLVLVVIALIFMGRINIFGGGVTECNNNGGECMATVSECTQEGGTIKSGGQWECEDAEYCCLKVS